MPDEHLIIWLSPTTIDRATFLELGGQVHWVYLGKKFQEKRRLEHQLGPSFTCINIARLHDQVAERLRQDFVRWSDELNRLNGKDEDWWYGPVSSRNVYRSDLFQLCCYREILNEIWAVPERRPAFVVVESRALAGLLEQWAEGQGIHVAIRGRVKAAFARTGAAAAFLARWAHFGVIVTLRKYAAMVYAGKPGVWEGIHPVVIHTSIHPDSLDASGGFSDRYFPSLYSFLERNNRTVAVLPDYFGFGYRYASLFSRMGTSSTRFIIPEQYLGAADLLAVIVSPLRLLFRKIQSMPFRGSDYSAAIREETLGDQFEDLLEATLFSRLLVRLRLAGLTPERFIDWYENQPKSRALARGARVLFPGVPVIGAQIFLHYPNYLSLSPSVSETEASVVPDVLLETSAHQCGMARIFVPDLACRPCAALRYAHVFDERRTHPPAREAKEIVVLTTYDTDATLELLAQTRSMAESLDKDVRLLVKFHPDICQETIDALFCPITWSGNMQEVTGTLTELLDHASLVISKSSGTIAEAAVKGVPVVVLGSQTKLNLNPLAGIRSPLVAECFTQEELRDAVQRFLGLTPAEREGLRQHGNQLRDLFFTPVTDATLAPFLE